MKYVYIILLTLWVFCSIVGEIESVTTWVGALPIFIMSVLLCIYTITGKDNIMRMVTGGAFALMFITIFIALADALLTPGNSITSFFNNPWYLLGKFVS